MPEYEYRCVKCKQITSAIRKVAERDNLLVCKYCGGGTVKIISLSRLQPDMRPYYDDNLETYITGRQHRESVMKKRGVTACG